MNDTFNPYEHKYYLSSSPSLCNGYPTIYSTDDPDIADYLLMAGCEEITYVEALAIDSQLAGYTAFYKACATNDAWQRAQDALYFTTVVAEREWPIY